jgi:hypothetical protein
VRILIQGGDVFDGSGPRRVGRMWWAFCLGDVANGFND